MDRRICWSVQLVPKDVIELMLTRLPVKSLMRFKAVSSVWKSIVESPFFQDAQLNHRRESRGPDILFATIVGEEPEAARKIVMGSSSIFTVDFSNARNTGVCHGGYDGLLCLYGTYTQGTIINPATRMSQKFPLSTVQQLVVTKYESKDLKIGFVPPKLGFGRARVSGTFKPVMLCNSWDFGLDNVTACEVFDFSTNVWRFLVPSSPYRVLPQHKPVFLDGSLYWLTECEQPKVVSLDLDTETFQVISETPFSHIPHRSPHSIIISTLGNLLCVSEKVWPNQIIWSWSLDAAGTGTWNQFCSLDLSSAVTWFGQESPYALLPIAVVADQKLLLHGLEHKQPLVEYDLVTGVFKLVFAPVNNSGHCIEYFQSLFSV